MNQWDEELIGCFGGVRGLPGTFGLHPHDERRAREWAESMRSRGFGRTEAEAQIRAYLISENQSAEKIDYQLTRAHPFFKG